jgi:phage gp29-like protein
MFGKGWKATGAILPGGGQPVAKPAFAEVSGAEAPDAIDDFVDSMDWQAMAEEPIAFMEQFIASVGSLAEAKAQLPGLLAKLPNTKLRDTLAQAGFETALAGRLDLSLRAN